MCGLRARALPSHGDVGAIGSADCGALCRLRRVCDRCIQVCVSLGSERADGERPSGNSWVYGVILAVLAALSNNVGVNMQKLAWTKKQLKLARGPVCVLCVLKRIRGAIT